jgi:ubiquinone/menaquinone biosynthesis C-methylase UbiE
VCRQARAGAAQGLQLAREHSSLPLAAQALALYGETNQASLLADELGKSYTEDTLINKLKGYQRFYSIAAKAEETTLSDASVDFIVAGQAFHWFDREKTKIEFNRILKPGGWTDYEQVDHRRIDAAVIREFFGSDNFRLKQFKNVQVFDYEGVKGRLLSSSYAPEEGHPKYEPMMAELQRIFQAHQAEGKVIFEYVTQMYYGQLS